MNPESIPSVRAARSVWRAEKPDVLALLIIPTALLWMNSVWLTNKFGDIDTWFYYGHFLSLFNQGPDIGPIPADYYRTRLPYILPGALLYKFLSDDAARFIFMQMVYSTTILSFWYVVRANTSRVIAFCSASLLALDLYFIRSMGWQYVDNGVLAYQALTLAFITAASRTAAHRGRYYVMAGFTATSMIFTHLASSVFGFTFALYVYVLVSRASPDTPLVKRMTPPFLFALLGAAICQVVYGVLNLWFYHNRFFFLTEQARIAGASANIIYTLPLSYLARYAVWLIIPGAALIGSLIGLVVSWRRRRSILDFDVFCFVNATFLLGLITLLEVVVHTCLLSREGLYISLFLIPAYLAIAALLFQPGVTTWRMAALVVVAFAASAWYRLAYDGNPPPVVAIPVAWLAVIGGVAVAAPVVFRSAVPAAVSLLLFCGVTIATPWAFQRDDSIRASAHLIRSVAGNRVPRIFFDGSDPAGKTLFWSIVGNFTERGWWRHGEGYPDFSRNFWQPYYDFRSGDLVVVLSSTVKDAETARTALSGYVESAMLVASFRVSRPDAPIWVHCFEITMPAVRRLGFDDRPADPRGIG